MVTVAALDSLLQSCSVAIEFSHRVSEKSLIDDDAVENGLPLPPQFSQLL